MTQRPTCLDDPARIVIFARRNVAHAKTTFSWRRDVSLGGSVGGNNRQTLFKPKDWATNICMSGEELTLMPGHIQSVARTAVVQVYLVDRVDCHDQLTRLDQSSSWVATKNGSAPTHLFKWNRYESYFSKHHYILDFCGNWCKKIPRSLGSAVFSSKQTNHWPGSWCNQKTLARSTR